MLQLALPHKNKVQVESEVTRLGAYRQKLSGLSLLPRLNGVVIVVASAGGYACRAIRLLFGCWKGLVYGKTFGASLFERSRKGCGDKLCGENRTSRMATQEDLAIM
jgi:hypothetical protein